MERHSSEGVQTTKVLIPAETLRQRLQEVARQINGDYVGREIDLVCLTNAAMILTADLVRLLEVPVRTHALAFTSYSPAPMSGEVRLTLDIGEPLQGRHVLVTEGMVISGRTPLYLMNLMRLRQPASLELCAIGSKPAELAVDLPIKYRLYEFGKEWVAGYGIGHGVEKASPDLLDLKP
ncbi:MAG: phosphoribosyltransferase [Rhodanobacter sp.]